MFKRAFWMSTGIAIGAGGAFWAKRRVEEAVERYLPEQVADRAADSARSLGTTLKAAAAEGRDAMRSTEAELRARVQERTFVGDSSAGGSAHAPRSAVHAGHSRTVRRRARR